MALALWRLRTQLWQRGCRRPHRIEEGWTDSAPDVGVVGVWDLKPPPWTLVEAEVPRKELVSATVQVPKKHLVSATVQVPKKDLVSATVQLR